MKKKDKESRTCILYTRLTPTEYEKLVAASKKTTFLRLSEYARALLTSKPVTNLYRNESADDFLLIAIELKNVLLGIGKTLQQAVDKMPPSTGKADPNPGTENVKAIAISVDQKTEEIKTLMHKIYNQWLLK